MYRGWPERETNHSQRYNNNAVNNFNTDISTATYLSHIGGDLLEKPTGFQLVKKFPAFYGTRMFITAFTSARHLSLS